MTRLDLLASAASSALVDALPPALLASIDRCLANGVSRAEILRRTLAVTKRRNLVFLGVEAYLSLGDSK